jgi:hypothetical protein
VPITLLNGVMQWEDAVGKLSPCSSSIAYWITRFAYSITSTAALH